MKFSDSQIAALQAKLDPSHVAQREQAGRKLSYIEGWHAIAEANRIFGFDAWNRETLVLQETSRDLVHVKGYNGKPDYDQWRVSYLARVRITLGEVVREGTGYGSGMAKPEALGEAIESAAKEAETDAMKRALMTFGNPFGLALYDKTQANVGREDEPAAAPVKSSAQLKRDNFWPDFERELDECTTLLMLDKFRTAWREKAIADGWNKAFKEAAKDRIEGREKLIMEAMDASELADVPLDKALQHSIKDNKYAQAVNAG